MSFAALSWAYNQRCRSGVAKSVLCYLANCAAQNGDCYPSIAKIINAVQHTERAVRKSIDCLIEDGQITREHRCLVSGRCTSPVYCVKLVVLSINRSENAGDLPEEQEGDSCENTVAIPLLKRQGDSCENARGTPAKTQENPLPDPKKEISPIGDIARARQISLSDEWMPYNTEANIINLRGQSNNRTKAVHKRTQIPEDWHPEEIGLSYASGLGVPLAREIPKFKHHHQGKGTLMANWNAAWRTWCDHAVTYGTATGKPANQTTSQLVGGF